MCDKCGRKMVVKSSRFGKFLACPGYPECKTTYSGIPLSEKCPECGAPMIKVITVNPETKEETQIIRCGNEKCKTNKKTKKQTVDI